MSIVEEKQVFEEANGGCLTKSAYYIMYISEKERRHAETIEVNQFALGD